MPTSRRRRSHGARAAADATAVSATAPSTNLVERGSFSHGSCGDCDWEGPGRRARNMAVEDAALHALTGCGLLSEELSQATLPDPTASVRGESPDQMATTA